jgi:hypothetical protein
LFTNPPITVNSTFVSKSSLDIRLRHEPPKHQYVTKSFLGRQLVHPKKILETGTVVEKTENIHLSKEVFDKLPEIAKNAIEASGIPRTISASVPEKRFSVATATVDESQDVAGIISSWRWDFGNLHGDWILTLNWSIITPKTAVFVAIGEGASGGPTAGKFIGAAKYTLFNVAPRAGAVDIWVNINWDSNIRIYVDYMVISLDGFGP